MPVNIDRTLNIRLNFFQRKPEIGREVRLRQ